MADSLVAVVFRADLAVPQWHTNGFDATRRQQALEDNSTER
jgi:hypothetical protein